METIHSNNRLSEHASDFFNRLRDYLDTKLYFYGSILRTDYLPGQSDIDVDIFTDNEAQIISQMSAFLHIPKQKFKKIILQSYITNRLIYGHKVVYDDPENSLKAEFAIYNEKNKREILTVSIGVAANDEGENVLHTLKKADTALYRAKETGRNRVIKA